jgi:hypothetical protein
MDTDEEKSMQKENNALERPRISEVTMTEFCFSVLKVFGFSLSVFICLHAWFQRFSPCA